MTESAQQSLSILRDGSMFQWYVIPMLTLVALVYANEVEKKNWNLVFAGLTYFGLDIFIEVVNSLIFHFSQFAPAWGTPGKTAYLLLIGMNIEICFMFAIVGIVMAKLLPKDKNTKILGMPNRIAVALGAAVVSATVEVCLNLLDVLTWEYPWWNRGPAALVIVGGYFLFFSITFLVHDLDTVKKKFSVVGTIMGVNAVCIIVFGLFLKWI